MGFILPNKSDTILEEMKVKFNNRTEREFSESLERVLNEDEHVYYWGACDSCEGFGSYDLCYGIKNKKNKIKKRNKPVNPVIEACKKDAALYVDIVQTFFNEYGIKRMGITMYHASFDIDENNFTKFQNDVTKLDDLTAEVIMKFKSEIIHYIVR